MCADGAIVLVDKPPGWTPLEALHALRRVAPAWAGAPMVYAGRLDPMAEGLLPVLVGEARHALAEHLAHDKDYDATFLFGVSSDTHDALGRLTPGGTPALEACRAAVAGLVGTHRLPLPAWSAFRVRGRPLHAWAAAGQLEQVVVPVRDMRVMAAGAVDAAAVRAPEVAAAAVARIAAVQGAFRQAEACGDWAGEAATRRAYVQVRARLTVASGVYVRALAHALGGALGCGGLLLALRRTRVGPFVGDDAVTLRGVARDPLADGLAAV